MTIRKKDTKGFLLGTAAGGVLGAVAALLLAPKAGKELRKDLAAGAQQAGDATVRIAGQVTETTGRFVKDLGGRTADLAAKTREAAVSVRDVFAGRKDGGADEANGVSAAEAPGGAADGAVKSENPVQ